MSWKKENDRLYKLFVFKNFTSAMAFMIEAGYAIEKMNHHPEWKNVYNRLEVWLQTHDAGNSVTDKDHKLAEKLDAIYAKYTLTGK